MERPGIVHRLDKNTSGLLVVAKHDMTHQKLQKQFTTRTIKRGYWALVWGVMSEKEGRIETGIGRSRRDPTKMTVSSAGRLSVTHYILLRDFYYCSLLSLRLETGRTHQIRVHMKHIHHPVVGDPEYDGRERQLSRLPVNLKKRGMRLLELLPSQFLHAKTLEFIHPVRNELMRFETPLPTGLQSVLDKLPQILLLEQAQ
jgi:23S rRNA pseudouridine1911/1915/1917 synthase